MIAELAVIGGTGFCLEGTVDEVETPYGKGHLVYVGLGLWRQLPAGTDGAYQLLANLISLGKAPPAGRPARATSGATVSPATGRRAR